MQITFSEKLAKADALVITVTDSLKLGKEAEKISNKTGGALKKAIKSRGFKAKRKSMWNLILEKIYKVIFKEIFGDDVMFTMTPQLFNNGLKK